jgi:plastocyanin
VPTSAPPNFTTVRFKGKKTVTVKLKAGKYKYYCAAHEATMFGHFTLH